MSVTLLFAGVVPLGAAVLRGVILANEMGGPPVANVLVASDGANDTATDAQGRFDLAFPNRQPGQTVRVVVNQPGHVVVNDVQLEVNLPETDSAFRVLLLVCKPEAREEMARRFYRLKSFEVIEASYQQQLGELKARGEATVGALARLLQERDLARTAADKAAEDLARVKPEDTSDVYQEAMRLFVSGKVEEALQVLDDEKLRQAAEAARRQAGQVVENYLLKARILATQFKFDEADGIYRRATNVVPNSFEACFGYAIFSQYLNRHQRALPAYERALALARLSGDEGKVAMTLNNLGNLHLAQNRMGEALQAQEEALRIRRALAETNPETYLPDVASTLNNLGILQSDQNRMGEALQAYEDALATYRKLAEANPETYLPYVATTLNNLGILHRTQNRMGEALEAYQEALKIHRKLAEASPETYLPDVASTLNNLGVLHHYQNRMGEALEAYEEALKTYRKLAEVNPETYLAGVAMALNNLGVLHQDQNRMGEALEAYEEALRIRRKLAETNPETYLPDVAETLYNLGVLHWAQNQMEDALRASTEALNIYQAFAKQNSERYQRDVERVQRLLNALKQEPASAR